MKEIFCDGVHRVVLSRGLVAIDFFHLVYEDDGPHKPVPFLTLTIPMRGVLNMLELGDQIVDHMGKIGILVSADSAPVEKKPVPAAAKNPEKKNVKSSATASKKVVSAPAKKADAKPAAKPAPAKKAEAKPAAKPAPAKKAEAKPASKPAPTKKADAKPAAKLAPAKKPAKGKKSAK